MAQARNNLSSMKTSQPLTFRFSPHILEDLGVNLYTSIAKALVEFVANAHDADATKVTIRFDPATIEAEMARLTSQYKLEKKNGDQSGRQPLAERTLPENVTIDIYDDGHGMSLQDLQNKFLLIGRRRRLRQPTVRTTKNRLIMGRKGLGKLAGFGIAHSIEVVTKIKEEPDATKITLNLKSLLSPAEGDGDISGEGAELNRQVPTDVLEDWKEFPCGTRIRLRNLVFQAVRSDLEHTLCDAMRENFYGIRHQDFAIMVNDTTVDTSSVELAYAYPEDEALRTDELKTHTLETDSGTLDFAYRIRFRPPRNQLRAKERGVRVYAHHRLAANPDLLDVKSSAHGFQYSSYLDGVVVADAIDELPTDFISTDRQGLRWDTPLLSELKRFLTEAMTRALAQYADTISKENQERIENDEFTKTTIDQGRLPKHRQRTAWRLAKTLADTMAGDLQAEFYQTTLKTIVNAIGHGEILNAIYALAAAENASFVDLIREITRLTKSEFDEFAVIVAARIKAIEKLESLVLHVDFQAPNNEGQLHELFELNPWLIDPTFFEFLTSDQTEESLASTLAKHLKIGKHVREGYNPQDDDEQHALQTNERPDLTFLLSNSSLQKLIIVELKAPNTPLHIEHLVQLEGYMRRADEFLQAKRPETPVVVQGLLVGSFHPNSNSEKVKDLKYRMQQGLPASLQIKDVGEILSRTKAAHQELLAVYRRSSAVDDAG